MTALLLLGMASPVHGNVSLGQGQGGRPTATLTTPNGAHCTVYLNGAHVTSWRPAGDDERLFVSSRFFFSYLLPPCRKERHTPAVHRHECRAHMPSVPFAPRRSKWARGQPIRGGIPICFPQFAGRGPLPKHGFARVSEAWEIEESGRREGGETELILLLQDNEQTRLIWPHSFSLRYTITLTDEELRTAIKVENRGAEPFEFTAALHTYLGVPDVTTTSVEGLSGLMYQDNAAKGATVKEVQQMVAMDEPMPQELIDRVYVDAPERLVVRAPGVAPLVLAKHGFRDAVLWNAGQVSGEAMSDLGRGEWRNYICLEAGAIVQPVKLAPQDKFEATQTISIIDSVEACGH